MSDHTPREMLMEAAFYLAVRYSTESEIKAVRILRSLAAVVGADESLQRSLAEVTR